MENLKIGLIGLSPGNGHPYSWGAICNGYDVAAMNKCPFPVIPEYLAEQDWPAARLPGVSITHIWTQSRVVSEDVAAAAKIPEVVDKMEDMIGLVDAVLLARDDPENHLAMTLPFLAAGIPVYVDKPLVTNRADANKLFAAATQEWHLYSCSALRYASEFHLTASDREAIGEILSIDAVTPKSWHNYAVHVIEPALRLLNQYGGVEQHKHLSSEGQNHVNFSFSGGKTLSVRALGQAAAPLELRVYGSKGNKTLRFNDSFTAFRKALAVFFEQVRTQKLQIPRQETMAVVELIEKGLFN